MKTRKLKTVLLAITTVLLIACGGDDETVKPILNDSETVKPKLNNEAIIKTLSFTTEQNTNLYQNVTTEIDEANKTITASVWVILPTAQLNTEISLIPEITFTNNATIKPAKNDAILVGGSNPSPVNYTVTAEDGVTTKSYTLTTTVKYINATAQEVININDLVALYAFKEANPSASRTIVNWDLDNPNATTIETSLTNNGVTLNANKKIDILKINRLNSLTVPSEIGNLTEMTVLDLFRNNISSLPEEIGQLTSLTKIALHNNNLTNLPSNFGNLTKLQLLFLSRNSFTTIPAKVFELKSLQRLIFDYNSLTEVPSEIGNLTNLRGLSLGNNNLQTLPTEIANLTALRSLNISDNQITTLPIVVTNITNLESLTARNNGMTSLPAEIGNSNMRILDLIGNNLTPSGLPDEIANMSSLAWIRLIQNPELNASATISTTLCNFFNTMISNGRNVQTDLDLSRC